MNLVPNLVVDRLPVYLRALNVLEAEGKKTVRSEELGPRAGVNPELVRKDLSYFGRFGKQGRGYEVVALQAELRRLLGTDRQWSMVLVGAGHLGRAILAYPGFVSEGFVIIAAFDTDTSLIGELISGMRVRPAGELVSFVQSRRVDIGIIAVPPAAARRTAEVLHEAGIRAILNYAPVMLRLPPGLLVRNVDPVIALESMTFWRSHEVA